MEWQVGSVSQDGRGTWFAQERDSSLASSRGGDVASWRNTKEREKYN